MGVTYAVLQIDGKVPDLREKSNIWQGGIDKLDEQRFRKMLGMRSGPLELELSNCCKVRTTNSGVIKTFSRIVEDRAEKW